MHLMFCGSKLPRIHFRTSLMRYITHIYIYVYHIYHSCVYISLIYIYVYHIYHSCVYISHTHIYICVSHISIVCLYITYIYISHISLACLYIIYIYTYITRVSGKVSKCRLLQFTRKLLHISGVGIYRHEYI